MSMFLLPLHRLLFAGKNHDIILISRTGPAVKHRVHGKSLPIHAEFIDVCDSAYLWHRGHWTNT